MKTCECGSTKQATCTCKGLQALVEKAMSLPQWECCRDNEHCTEDSPCESCCDHSDTDDYCCLDCGKELTEDRMCRAYDAWKDRD